MRLNSTSERPDFKLRATVRNKVAYDGCERDSNQRHSRLDCDNPVSLLHSLTFVETFGGLGRTKCLFKRGRLLKMKKSLAILFITALVVSIATGSHKSSASEKHIASGNQSASPAFDTFSLPADSEAGTLMLYETAGGIGCRSATPDEARLFSRSGSSEQVHRISSADQFSIDAKGGLKIILRATQQLEGFPETKAAFLRAAAIWTDKIQTPITLVIDVDFGPTWFGTAYGPQILGSTSPQDVTSDSYRAVRAQLIAGSSNEHESAIYNSLPLDTVPTDFGNTSTIRAPSANARALGLLDAVADPDGKEKNLGKPPAIGFNSKNGFDYDPSDGISPNLVDFEAVAVHEIGHALGFRSCTEERQGDSKAPIALSVWDLFRVRPGSPSDALATTPRILNAGGEQMSIMGGIEVPLSTGSAAHGGDGRSSWHWKDDSLINGRFIGIMEPGIATGTRHVMTAYDLLAIRMMGYQLRSGIQIAPELDGISGGMQGDSVTITGLAVNIENDTIEAEVKVLDDAGHVLGEYPLAAFTPANFSVVEFALQFPGINQWRAASQASLTVLDVSGNRSQTLTTGILKGQPGAPTLLNVSFDGSVLRIKGKRLTEQLSLEVNGELVPLPNVRLTGKKAFVEATASELRLSAGPNRVRIVIDGLRSNASVLVL